MSPEVSQTSKTPVCWFNHFPLEFEFYTWQFWSTRMSTTNSENMDLELHRKVVERTHILPGAEGGFEHFCMILDS